MQASHFKRVFFGLSIFLGDFASQKWMLPHSPSSECFVTPKVDGGVCDVVQILNLSLRIVMIHEGFDLGLWLGVIMAQKCIMNSGHNRRFTTIGLIDQRSHPCWYILTNT